MITILDDDPPIEAAKKIIYGIRGDENNPKFTDMYDNDDIYEISQYLTLYCNLNNAKEYQDATCNKHCF